MVVNVAQGVVSWINLFNTHTHTCTHTHTLAGVFRRNYSEVLAEKAAPTIPVQPISYADAIHFMRYIAYPFYFLVFHFPFLIFPLVCSFLPASWMGMKPLPPGRDNWVSPTTSHNRRPISQSQSVSTV